MVTIGDAVVYVDPRGAQRPALVTAVHGQPGRPDEEMSINIVFVNDDEHQRDDYGRKIARETSVVHRARQSAHGMFWQ